MEKILELLSGVTYAIEHNPNCPSPFLVRLCGMGAIDHKPVTVTRDAFGYGKTLKEAAEAAVAKRVALVNEMRG